MHSYEEYEAVIKSIEDKMGSDVLKRFHRMTESGKDSYPISQRGAKWILPDLSTGGWLDKKILNQPHGLIDMFENNASDIIYEFNNYLSQAKIESYNHYKVAVNGWTADYYYKNDQVAWGKLDRLPTLKKVFENGLLQSLCPLLECHLSVLAPGVKIPPHHDLWNFSVNLHFAIKIPKDCAIKVDGEIRTWEEGKCLLFDYSYEHEAWNESNEDRVCLLMDIWHPGVTLPEREAIVALINFIRQSDT